jgi:hypothetical protein
MDRQFYADAAERLVKTAVQSLLAYFAAGAVDVVSADWGEALTVAGTAALISLLTSLLSVNFGHSGTASLTTAVEPAGRHAAPDAT